MSQELQTEKTKKEIMELKRAKKAIILAHNYQPDEIQEIADYTGDSFGLSQQAAATDAEVIVFCGVHFMAESAAILAPEKTILLPEKNAGCPLADTVTPEELSAKKDEYPQAAVVSYVNTSAAVKAESDICCTSSNAVKVVHSLGERQILFVPDGNLAHWVAKQTDKEIIPWKGYCITHQRVTGEDVDKVRELHPDAVIAVHPECRPEVVSRADFVGSTSAILRFARQSAAQKIIVGTEMGILYRLKFDSPQKQFYLLSAKLICVNMKMTNLPKVLEALKTGEPRVVVEEPVRSRAYNALQRMLAVT
ncbi:MAG: quinolinate synthase NadA [Bacillota bacterium]